MRLHILPTFWAGTVADVTTARVRSWREKLLAAGVGEPSVGAAYQLLHAPFPSLCRRAARGGCAGVVARMWHDP